MELSQLRIFLAAAESKSFSAAARSLYISHSGVSRAVAALEEELGVRLIKREGNMLFGLTKAGQELKRRSEELLRMAEQTAQAVQLAGDEDKG